MYQLKIPGRHHFNPGLALVAATNSPQGIRAALEMHSQDGGSLAHLNLAGLDLSGANFADNTNFEGSSFHSSRLEGVQARGGYFAHCDLSYACMSASDLRGACFVSAQADGLVADSILAKKASFSGAKIRRAVFNGADLRSADFSHADAQQASFKGADLLLASCGRMAFDSDCMAGCKTPLDVIQRYANMRTITSDLLEKYPHLRDELEDAK
ncbi:pentapeptide repeat-containing protein [Cupriavidus nantongensis]|uniref:pentapeptide repeat-containing protein n=1 Tax=Cupriavidus nantongensis TaxID=1796606 RepID=UPI00358FB3C5